MPPRVGCGDFKVALVAELFEIRSESVFMLVKSHVKREWGLVVDDIAFKRLHGSSSAAESDHTHNWRAGTQHQLADQQCSKRYYRSLP